MSSFLTAERLDICFFLIGIAFLLLALTSRELCRMECDKFKWRWFALFGFAKWINAWMDMVSVEIIDYPAFTALRILTNYLSYIFLLTFACNTLFGGRSKKILIAAASILTALTLTGLYNGLDGLDVMVRAAIGIPVCLAVSFFLIRYALTQSANGAKSSLMLAGILLIPYSIVTGVFLDSCCTAGGAFLKSGANSGLHISMILNAVLIMAISLCICRYYFIKHSLIFTLEQKGHIKPPRTYLNFLIVYLLLTIFGIALTEIFAAYVKIEDKEDLLQSAISTASVLDANVIEGLTGTKEDVSSPVYQKLKKQLMSAVGSDESWRFVYILRNTGKDVVFLADSESEDSKDYSAPGDVYHEVSSEVINLFAKGTALFEGPLADRWGTWVSAIAPIFDQYSGERIALLGIDINAHEWSKHIAIHRLLPISSVAFLYVIVCYFFIVGLRQQEFAFNIANSEEKYRMLFSMTSDAVFIHDLDGKFIEVNEAACEKLGYSREEMLKMSLADIDDEDNIALIEERIGRLIKDGKWVFETVHKTKYGRHIEQEVNSRRIEYKGQTLVLSIARDITARKKIERELVKSVEAAESAERAKSEFLANMSHEIRTPMTGIIGMNRLLLDTNLTAEQRDYLNMSLSSAESLLGILNDILDFSKIEAGKFELSPIDFGLRGSLESCVKMQGAKAQGKGLEFICDISTEVPEGIIGDPGRLKQVINNLCDNAIKFTKAGEIGLSVNVVSEDERQAVLKFSVSDTGIGIAQDRLSSIFEPFVQADGTISRKFGGTGLGLSISKNIAKAMGGNICAQRREGGGSIFCLTIPFQKQPLPLPQPDLVSPSLLAGMRVLAVDDNATNLTVITKMLAQLGLDIEACDSAAKAIESAKNAAASGKSFKLILSDASMPDIDGYELIENVRKLDAMKDVKAIVLTSIGMRGDSAKCHKTGILAYLMKPVMPEELARAIRTVFGIQTDKDSEYMLVTRHSIKESMRRGRILVADDNQVNRVLAGRMFEKWGHSVVTVSNGREAVDAVVREDFDVIFMDVQMPVVDGIEATREIRAIEDSTKKNVHIIAMTAHALTGDKEKFLAAGMNDYVSKPFVPTELEKALSQALAAKGG